MILSLLLLLLYHGLDTSLDFARGSCWALEPGVLQRLLNRKTSLRFAVDHVVKQVLEFSTKVFCLETVLFLKLPPEASVVLIFNKTEQGNSTFLKFVSEKWLKTYGDCEHYNAAREDIKRPW